MNSLSNCRFIAGLMSLVICLPAQGKIRDTAPAELAVANGAPTVRHKGKIALEAWTPRHSIPIRYLLGADPEGDYLSLAFMADEPFVWVSPDGRRFGVVTVRGDLGCDCNLQHLELFDAAEVAAWVEGRGKRPKAIFTREWANAGSSSTSLRFVSWSADGRSIDVVAEDERHSSQLYRVELGTGAIQQMTSGSYGADNVIMRSALPKVGDGLLYSRYAAGRNQYVDYPTTPIRRDELGDIHLLGFSTKITCEWLIAFPDRESWKLPFDWPSMASAFASDGKFGVVAGPPSGNASDRRIQLIDVDRRAVSPLVAMAGNAPFKALWSDDGSHVLLINAGLPQGLASPAADATHFLLDYEPASGRYRVLQGSAKPFDVTAIDRLAQGDGVLVPGAGAETGTVYRASASGWQGAVAPAGAQIRKVVEPKLAGGLTFSVRQDANDPVMLVASVGKKQRDFLDPDPALANVKRARVEPFEYLMPDGRKITAALSLPAGRKPGERVPLVVQNYFSGLKRFFPDGNWTTGDARQTLVAQGYAVLMLPGVTGSGSAAFDAPNGVQNPAYASPAEGDYVVSMLDAAVDELDRRGIVDTARVGMTGFSRGSWQTHYVITHPGRTRIGAAVMNGASGLDFFSMLWGELGGALASKDKVWQRDRSPYGARFWQDREEWSHVDPLFNVDKSRSPVLIASTADGLTGQALDEPHPDGPGTFAVIAAYRINRRPVDAIFFPTPSTASSRHNLIRPRERVASMEATVDWMNFWLKGQEDPDPAKADRYKVWRKLKARWQEQQAWEAAGHPPGSAPEVAKPVIGPLKP